MNPIWKTPPDVLNCMGDGIVVGGLAIGDTVVEAGPPIIKVPKVKVAVPPGCPGTPGFPVTPLTPCKPSIPVAPLGPFGPNDPRGYK